MALKFKQHFKLMKEKKAVKTPCSNTLRDGEVCGRGKSKKKCFRCRYKEKNEGADEAQMRMATIRAKRKEKAIRKHKKKEEPKKKSKCPRKVEGPPSTPKKKEIPPLSPFKNLNKFERTSMMTAAKRFQALTVKYAITV